MQASHTPRGKFNTTLVKLVPAEKSPLATDNSEKQQLINRCQDST